MNTKQRKYKNAAMVFLTILLLLSSSWVFSQEKATLATTEITLKGNAEGGVLTLIGIPNRNTRHVSISTEPGESSESVAMRLADIINNLNPFEWGGGYFEVIAKDGSLTLLGAPGTYALAGTEKGLGIPEPPTSLSSRYDVNNDRVILNWQNPASGFDGIIIITDRYPLIPCGVIAGSEEQYVYELRGQKIRPTYFCIIGIRDGVPSSPGAVYLYNNSQEELFGIPFKNGVAPNWTAWSTRAEVETRAFKQGEKYTNLHVYNPVRGLLTKPFYQVIKAPQQGAINGVWRKFLGLTPGHTYRITACLTTLEMDSIEEDWSLSLCVAHNGPDGKDLTVQQLAGLASLPNGKSGQKAGRIASFNQNNTTKGEYKIIISGEDPSIELETSNTTLPVGVDTITVWLRFSCSNPNGEIGFSGVKLEDITAIDNVKAPDMIRMEEHQEEDKLIEREQQHE